MAREAMSLPDHLPAGGFLAIVGLIYSVNTVSGWLSWLWLYLRQSSLPRYNHTAADGRLPWALVTGSTGGLGKALCHELASRGFNVVLHGRSINRLQRLEDEMLKAHPTREFRTFVVDSAQSFAVNVEEKPDDWAAKLEDINLTVVINNAGGSADRTFGTADALGRDRLITDASVNAMFPTLLSGQLIPLLNRNAPALIINIGSLADNGPARVGSYPASKTYLMKLTETLGREMRLTKRDIEVLGVRIGNIWGTKQTVSPAPSPTLLAPSPETIAKAVLGKVGCGRHVVVGHWAQSLQIGTLGLVPDFFREHILTNLARDWDNTGAAQDKDE